MTIAITLAYLRLGKIVYLYDSNQVTLSGSTSLIFMTRVFASLSIC